MWWGVFAYYILRGNVSIFTIDAYVGCGYGIEKYALSALIGNFLFVNQSGLSSGFLFNGTACRPPKREPGRAGVWAGLLRPGVGCKQVASRVARPRVEFDTRGPKAYIVCEASY